MREINFSSMCHIFVISRGLPGHSLLIILYLFFIVLAITNKNSLCFAWMIMQQNDINSSFSGSFSLNVFNHALTRQK